MLGVQKKLTNRPTDQPFRAQPFVNFLKILLILFAVTHNFYTFAESSPGSSSP